MISSCNDITSSLLKKVHRSPQSGKTGKEQISVAHSLCVNLGTIFNVPSYLSHQSVLGIADLLPSFSDA